MLMLLCNIIILLILNSINIEVNYATEQCFYTGPSRVLISTNGRFVNLCFSDIFKNYPSDHVTT